jgi:Protein of unknown function (DUF1566)
MWKHMATLGTVFMAAVSAAWLALWITPAFAKDKEAPVPATGQTECWDETGDPIPCAGTGQDGDIQAGVPLPTPRFRDQGDGTVKDHLTNLIWLQDASCFGTLAWQDARDAANRLADDPTSTETDCGLTDGSRAGDWRLPNIRELQSLIDFRFSNPALSNAAGKGPWTRRPVLDRAVGPETLLLLVYHVRNLSDWGAVYPHGQRPQHRQRQGRLPRGVAGPGGYWRR